jgi:hypothetical protein
MLPLLLSAALITPATELRAATADIQTVAPQLRPTTRYLTLYSIDETSRPTALQVTSYVLNALSRARSITAPELITPTLIRFNLTQYAPEPDDLTAWLSAWEQLATTDPYFHLQTEVLVSGNADKKQRTTDHGQRTTAITTDGPWLDLTAAASLRAATASTGAILRADYFITAATQPPAYYQFAGIPETESDFLKSLGVDRDIIQRLRADVGANLITSGVTGKPRRIVWSQGPLGGVYSTLDVQQIDATRDPLRRPISTTFPIPHSTVPIPNSTRISSATGSHQTPGTRPPDTTFSFRYDVSEWFALAPNGLWRTALYDAAGRRQNSVPDRVAKDTSDPHADGIIIPLISCIRCHRESGLRPFSDDQQLLLGASLPLPRGEGRGEGAAAADGRSSAVSAGFATAPPAVSLYSPDPNISRRAAEFYDEPRLQRQIAFDRQTYAAALSRATTFAPLANAHPHNGRLTTDNGRLGTGNQPLTSPQLSDSLATFVRNYAYLPVTPEQAASEVGLTIDQFQQSLAQSHDPIILLLLQNRPILRDQWTSSFSEAAAASQTLNAKR